MRQALTAIQTLFNASDELKARFPDGIYHGNGPDNKALPFCRLVRVSTPRDYSTGHRITKYRIQLDVFATRDADGETFVLQALDEIMSLFDFCTLEVEGFMEMRSVNDACLEEDDAWHGFVEYEIDVSSNE